MDTEFTIKYLYSTTQLIYIHDYIYFVNCVPVVYHKP